MKIQLIKSLLRLNLDKKIYHIYSDFAHFGGSMLLAECLDFFGMSRDFFAQNFLQVGRRVGKSSDSNATAQFLKKDVFVIKKIYSIFPLLIDVAVVYYTCH